MRIPCQDCHYATMQNGTTITTSGTHVNAFNDVGATVGSFNGQALNLVYSSPNCTTISCHGNYRALAWTVGTTSCDNCHGTVISTGGMATTVASTAQSSGPSSPTSSPGATAS